MDKGLVVKNISKSYIFNGDNLKVLDDIAFTLAHGDFLTVLGPSGCGKSTLIRCICGFEVIDEGEIYLNEKQIIKPSTDRIMVFQDFNQLFAWQTVLENVRYPLKINNIGKCNNDRTAIAEKYIEMVHLLDFKNAYPNQLSGGMRQRVAIARALALQPEVLLMDEPFGALDAQTRTILQKELIQIWQKTNSTIIFITHNIQESILLGNKIIVLSKRPARVKAICANEIKRPRMPETPEFMKLWKKLYSQLDIKRF